MTPPTKPQPHQLVVHRTIVVTETIDLLPWLRRHVVSLLSEVLDESDTPQVRLTVRLNRASTLESQIEGYIRHVYFKNTEWRVILTSPVNPPQTGNARYASIRHLDVPVDRIVNVEEVK